MKILNLVNVKLNNDKIIFEFTIEQENLSEDIQIYMKTQTGIVYRAEIIKADNRLKASIESVVEENVLYCTIFENNEEQEVQILNNKNEEIVQQDNQYKIFYKDKVIQISNHEIKITSKKVFEKLKYELFKIRYGIRKYKKLYLLRLLKRKNKYYLFNDRLWYADDNAEELFRHINKHNVKAAKKSYFVLDKNSAKLHEIKKVGKVLKYGSLKHKIKYLNAKMVISSHASYNDNMFNPFDCKEMQIYKDIITKKFIFLQHGIIMNNVSDLLNRCHITADLFVTSMKREYEDVLTNKYLYDKEQVVCTGLSRFDKLIDKRKNIILIAPTWRTTLINKENIENSEYYITYKNILQSQQIQNQVIEKGYKIYFLVHPAFDKYRDSFEKLGNENVKILIANEVQYSELFNTCSVFITDYSSTHFDVAILQKPIIYYQFDKSNFFENHYQPGFFSYEKDGFGEVIEEEKALINKICYYVENECKIEDKYIEKIKESFVYTDQNNSKRIWNEIEKIDTEELNYRFNNVH